jgi:hypothetical protein
MEEALDFVLKEQRENYLAWRDAVARREMKEWGIVTKEKEKGYRAFAEYREKNLVRAADLKHPAPNGHFLRQFGQSDRELIENSSRDASVMQALMMMNGGMLRHAISLYSPLSRELKGAKNDDEAIDIICLSTLSRRATPEEKQVLVPMLAGDRSTGRGDAIWTMLNTRQFLFIQ